MQVINVHLPECLRKVIGLVAKQLGFSDKALFMEPYLGLLIKKWYFWKKSLDDFPFNLLGWLSEKDFFVSILPFIVPLYIGEKVTTNLQKISSSVGRGIEELVEVHFTTFFNLLISIYLQESYSEVMSNCLLLFCSSESISSGSQNEIDCYKNSYNNLITILGKDKVTELLTSKLDGIVVNLIKLVFDLPYFDRVVPYSESVLYEPESPFYTLNVLHKIFTYVEVSCFLYLKKFVSNIVRLTGTGDRWRKFHHTLLKIIPW